MSSVFTGYLALGYLTYGIGAPVFTEVAGGSYARQSLNFTGSYSGGLSETSGSIAASATPVGQPITHAALYSASTGGYLIGYFPLVTAGVVGTAYTLGALSVQLSNGLFSDFADSGAIINAGASMGTVNGQPFIAGSQLNVQNGSIVPLASWANEGLIQVPAGGKCVIQVGGVTVASIDGSGNLVLLGTSTPSGSPG